MESPDRRHITVLGINYKLKLCLAPTCRSYETALQSPRLNHQEGFSLCRNSNNSST